MKKSSPRTHQLTSVKEKDEEETLNEDFCQRLKHYIIIHWIFKAIEGSSSLFIIKLVLFSFSFFLFHVINKERRRNLITSLSSSSRCSLLSLSSSTDASDIDKHSTPPSSLWKQYTQSSQFHFNFFHIEFKMSLERERWVTLPSSSATFSFTPSRNRKLDNASEYLSMKLTTPFSHAKNIIDRNVLR